MLCLGYEAICKINCMILGTVRKAGDGSQALTSKRHSNRAFRLPPTQTFRALASLVLFGPPTPSRSQEWPRSSPSLCYCSSKLILPAIGHSALATPPSLSSLDGGDSITKSFDAKCVKPKLNWDREPEECRLCSILVRIMCSRCCQ